MRKVCVTAGWLCMALACSWAAVGSARAAEPPRRDEKAAADDKDKKPKDSKPAVAAANSGAALNPAAAPTGPKTYTNEDLERLFGPPKEEEPPATEPAEGTEPPEGTEVRKASRESSSEMDPLALMEEQQQQALERAKRTEDAERKVERARGAVADLEKRSLGIRNPFLARPAPPEDEEARREWEAMDSVQRAEANAKRLEDARAALQSAERELEAARQSGL